MENQFTVGALFKHMLRNAWWIIVLGIVGGVAMFVLTNKVATTTYEATRQMYIGKNNTDAKDPNSRVMADSWLLQSYAQLAKDDAVVNAAVADLKADGIKIKPAALVDAVHVSPKKDTLLMTVRATANSNKKAVKYVNAYAKAFKTVAPEKLSAMPEPVLFSAPKKAVTVTTPGGSSKKALVFGAAAGLLIGIVLAFFTGIYKNMKATA